ncbi:hypothetical protein GBAR_LOCUS10705 [Geodia barretti]|uniref:Uncharacterized protein n=1 Tax=Geodia barretti TaxID=519541 RepID=A0AA35RW91_GEOBA|nr:hypothetical protein GBAR_LOCUS10705 [Geodia barretti]
MTASFTGTSRTLWCRLETPQERGKEERASGYTATWHYLCRISCSITRGVWFRWQTKDQTQTAPNFSSRTPSSHIWT